MFQILRVKMRSGLQPTLAGETTLHRWVPLTLGLLASLDASGSLWVRMITTCFVVAECQKLSMHFKTNVVGNSLRSVLLLEVCIAKCWISTMMIKTRMTKAAVRSQEIRKNRKADPSAVPLLRILKMKSHQ